MTKVIELNAEIRDAAGKGAARKIRNNNRIPAVVYGQHKTPTVISLCFNEVLKYLNQGGFKQADIHILVDGKTIENAKFQAIQLHPVKNMPHHIDFVRIAA